MSLTLRVLIGLLAGLAIGLGIASAAVPALAHVVPFLEPVGQLWIAGIRMTVIPLVMSSLIVGVGTAPDPRAVGRLGVRAFVLFLVLLAIGALFAVVAGPAILALLPIDPAGAEALRASAGQSAGVAEESVRQVPTVTRFVLDLVPVNPVKAMADGAMLPLIVFSLAFGVAANGIDAGRRASLMRVTEAVKDVSLRLVQGVLSLAPIGVFALAVPLAAKLGVAAAGALATYVALVAGVNVLYTIVILYPSAVLLGGVPLRAFAKAVFPAQAVAFASRSSLAALPAMLESTTNRLRLPAPISSFLIPLAATTFRTGGVIGQLIGVLFVARLYDVPVGAAQMVAMAVTAVAISFSVPGIPGGILIVMVPVMMAAGIPVAGVGLLFGVDTLPDMFRTTTNITGDMTAAAILAKYGGIEPASDPGPMPGGEPGAASGAEPGGEAASAHRTP